jgi:hypothetical protein
MGKFFWPATDWVCVSIILVVHHAGISAQMSFSRADTKFPNRGDRNAFLTRANEHYLANLRGVNAQLRAQVIKTLGPLILWCMNPIPGLSCVVQIWVE